ncbi:Serine/threonine-protein phosphatase 7 long form-like protein [Melia azedarach]|uniref:Serine/threonine-protein phosphatase 7 long form-like protein n=1 Tax=Melia azedarach TaxID=155640 RepID=A0ACC1Y2N4_MELAZ|nr:Serine/threonine-protein phosphatase 7 long form-like protein [Melia azedarach]
MDVQNLSTNFPGPIDTSVLYEQEQHVSSAIWEGQDRGTLRCHEHTSKIDGWKLTKKQIDLVGKAGFGHFRLIGQVSLNNPLISALVERWRRETNTFHLPNGEITITLDEVTRILGLRVNGEAVVRDNTFLGTNTEICESLLGKAPNSDAKEIKGGMVKLSWLKENFSECPKDASNEEVEQRTRAFLLYLVGSTIFATTSGNLVPLLYLPLFKDFDKAGKYAWGAAALAFLYRQLGKASMKSQGTISGSLTLLQCWSYFHLNIGRPDLKQDLSHRFPLALHWKGRLNNQTKSDVVVYRQKLDSLESIDIDWTPYKDLDSGIPENVRGDLILGKSRTILICMDKAEWHLPDRCLRQFGLHQSIPTEVQRRESKSNEVDNEVDTSKRMDLEVQEWSNRLQNIVDGVEDGNGTDESEYIHWYSNITRKKVHRQAFAPSQFQESVAEMMKIQEIAYAASTEDLNIKNKVAFEKIKSLVDRYLANRVEGFKALEKRKRTSEDGQNEDEL